MTVSPILLWHRRDLRLGDHPALAAAAATGRPVVPVYILDSVAEGQGACPLWRTGLSLEAHAKALDAIGSRLILRRGDALGTLRGLIEKTGAGAVWWQRLYDPDAVARDEAVRDALDAAGIDVRVFAGHVLHEPSAVETKTGGCYKVYTPFWRAIRQVGVAAPEPSPARLTPPEAWPDSEELDAWALGRRMDRGASVVARFAHVGEAAARERLAAFAEDRIDDYAQARDVPASGGTSMLSENLTYGEIGIREVWHAGLRARDEGRAGAETFLKELAWRDFAYHLLHHTPRLTDANWRPEWDAFPWNEDDTTSDVRAWQQGRTGIAYVDAAMREMYVTGHMHNRSRMIVASYLTKHLMTHWRIGQRWFEEHLIDWDVASNALGWQWAAGSGPDATPFFRVFNPVTQLDKFDPQRAYADRWIAEGKGDPHPDALTYFDAIPRSWGLAPDDAYPAPVVPVDTGRKRALDAYAGYREATADA